MPWIARPSHQVRSVRQVCCQPAKYCHIPPASQHCQHDRLHGDDCAKSASLQYTLPRSSFFFFLVNQSSPRSGCQKFVRAARAHACRHACVRTSTTRTHRSNLRLEFTAWIYSSNPQLESTVRAHSSMAQLDGQRWQWRRFRSYEIWFIEPERISWMKNGNSPRLCLSAWHTLESLSKNVCSPIKKWAPTSFRREKISAWKFCDVLVASCASPDDEVGRKARHTMCVIPKGCPRENRQRGTRKHRVLARERLVYRMLFAISKQPKGKRAR